MNSEDKNTRVRITFPDGQTVEYPLSEIDALELEAYAITRVHKRLMRRTLRIIENLKEKTEVTLSYILENSGSRSGDIYNVLKYLEYKKLIQLNRETKIVIILAPDALLDLYNKINRLI